MHKNQCSVLAQSSQDRDECPEKPQDDSPLLQRGSAPTLRRSSILGASTKDPSWSVFHRAS